SPPRPPHPHKPSPRRQAAATPRRSRAQPGRRCLALAFPVVRLKFLYSISRNHGQTRSESTGICFEMTTAPCSGICPARTNAMPSPTVPAEPYRDPTDRSPYQVNSCLNHHVPVVFHTNRHVTVKSLSRKVYPINGNARVFTLSVHSPSCTFVRMDDDVEKRYENMKSKTRALSNIIWTGKYSKDRFMEHVTQHIRAITRL
ncbi:hypothetical protein EJB05_27267, partial [Eragrostis curvula]